MLDFELIAIQTELKGHDMFKSTNLTLRKQKGTVIVLTALSLIVILGMIGLAIDLGHAYVNKTRLQNALDATALSARSVTGLIGETVVISSRQPPATTPESPPVSSTM